MLEESLENELDSDDETLNLMVFNQQIIYQK